MTLLTSAAEFVPVGSLVPFPGNPRRGDIAAIAESLRHTGQYRPIVVRRGSREVLVGNHTLRAAIQLGWERISATWVEVDDAQAKRIVLADNRIADLGGYDDDALLDLLGEVETLDATGYSEDDVNRLLDLAGGTDYGDALTGEGDAEESEAERAEKLARSNDELARAKEVLAEPLEIVPGSVLDARGGQWRLRKQAWIALGIRSEIGRGDDLTYHQASVNRIAAQRKKGRRPQRRAGLTIPSDSGRDPQYYEKKRAVERRLGRKLSTAEFQEKYYEADEGGNGGLSDSGTSVFDPTLCEVAVRWWCPPGGRILDPFAGGSVRGLVAGRLGCSYLGVDLRAEQVAANEEQRGYFTDRGLLGDARSVRARDRVRWVVGDARDIERHAAGEPAFDLLLTCPPYYDLERYSADPADLSNCENYPEFLRLYGDVLAGSVRLLSPSGFAVLVVGNLRDKDGYLRDFAGDTVRLMAEAGMRLVSSAVLLTPLGSVAIRAGRPFIVGRKLGRAHQVVQVFAQGKRPAQGWEPVLGLPR